MKTDSAGATLLLLLCSTTFEVPSFAHAEQLECVMAPNMIVNVNSGAEGVLEEVLVDRGTLVQRDEPVAALESSLQEVAVKVARARTETEAAIKTNQARVDFGSRRLVRIQELASSGISPISELDEAETAKLLADLALVETLETQRIAELELERAEAELRLRTIRSPVTGIVIERMLSPGDLAGGTPILRIAQLDPLRVEVFAPVSFLEKVFVGLEAVVRPQAPFTGSYKAHVTVVDRVVDTASETVGIRLRLPNPNYQLPAGLKCTVDFAVE